jgi:hypothetical protein
MVRRHCTCPSFMCRRSCIEAKKSWANQSLCESFAGAFSRFFRAAGQSTAKSTILTR